MGFRTLTVVIGMCLSVAAPGRAQTPSQADVTALAKATQNPVGDLTSLPFQFNFNTGGDLGDATLFNLNFQPVIPFKVTSKWNAIARTIIPIDSVPTDGGLHVSGIGDIQEQVYFSPSRVGRLIWGVGPVFSFPTATVAGVTTGTWAGGVGVVALTMQGPWVIGGLVNQYWPMSDAGGEPKTNQFVLQPFVNYNFGAGWALGFSPLMSANWDAASGDQWTVPLGAGISRTTVLDARPMTIGVQYYYNVVRPSGTAGELLRFSVSLLYPRSR